MSQNQNPPNLMRQLSIGNVVNVTLHLYRANLKSYLKLSLSAYLWLLVPLYGWAKFLSISALISRLAFCELMGQPESVRDAERYVRPRTCSFLFTAILIFFVLFGTLIISFILTGLFLSITRLEKVIAPFESVADERFVRTHILLAVFFLLVLLLFMLMILTCLFLPALWVYSRFFIIDLPLSSEANVNAITSLCRSWKLTRGYFWGIQIILIISIVLFLPLEILLYFTGELINVVTSKLAASFLSSNSLADSVLVEMFSWGITLFNAVMLMPFFQLIKAVVYYNLRLRREGLGLRLHEGR